jgi:hypothetical protein
MKIVVFDLDETLGYFTEFGILWDCLINYLKNKNGETLTQSDFNDILDLFPEFLRPNIINILNYLKSKKQSLCCHKMMIYTNNTGPPEWVHYIISYFESKIKYKLIDQLISAFKINGKQVEISRTTHNKTHNDLIRCTKIPANAEICFLDDVFYPDMSNDRIYYINVRPYIHDLEFDDMISRCSNMDILTNNTNEFDAEYFKQFMTTFLNRYNYIYVKEIYFCKIKVAVLLKKSSIISGVKVLFFSICSMSFKPYLD